MPRIIRSARPDAINAHDRARMAAHVARADRKAASAAGNAPASNASRSRSATGAVWWFNPSA